MDTVKKLALSVSVIVLFALYALQKQAQPLLGVVTLPERGAAASPSAIVASPRAAAWQSPTGLSATIRANDRPALPTPSVASVAFVDDAGRATATATATIPPTLTPAPTATPDVTLSKPAGTAVPTAIPTGVPTAPALAQGAYRDGTYNGGPADANWGEVDVQAVIADGRLQAVRFLQYPNHRGRSVAINQRAMPILTQEAMQAQQADVDVVTGATDTSEAFIQSLGAALQQATT